ARALAEAGREVVVLEKAEAVGTETSSRNSEVIHAGIYYPTGSLKAALCVEGKHRLYEFCRSRGVPFDNCGKLIVATDDDQVSKLKAIQAKAAENGVPDLVLMTPAEVERLEPAVRCKAALFSPSTGVIDSHAFMLALEGDAEAAGTMIAFHTPVVSGRVEPDGIVIETGGTEPMTVRCRSVVNSGGLHAPSVARSIVGVPRQTVPPQLYAKGNYFSLIGRQPFSRLIYPMPDRHGLGVHVTIDLGRQARFGPDVEWVDEIDYDVDPRRCEKFYAAVRTYWPDLPDDALAPAYSGIRPKISGPDQPAADYRIDGPAVHGVPGLINLYGIESPGLTAALAIADRVAGLLASSPP
ncbi:MAG: NAD(P)/FAD-dependent oxidoreductase, partial [Alphaproteobacteria bacterium]